MDRYELMKQSYEDLKKKIEWHCVGRHGVIREIPKEIANEINNTLVYFFGSKCGLWRKTPDKPGYMDVEFVHMTKVYPPPKKPWEWCGTTVLFKDFQERERQNRAAFNKFDIGDKVWFRHRNIRYEGIVSGGRKRIAVIVGNDKWYVVPRELNKIGG